MTALELDAHSLAANLRVVARDPKRPVRTQLAARNAADVLDRFLVCLAIDAGAPTHEVLDKAGTSRVCVLGPAPAPATGEPVALPSFHAATVSPDAPSVEVPR